MRAAAECGFDAVAVTTPDAIPQAPERLARAVGGVLFFAGEATADVLELGTVHGALASGERAAREMERRLAKWRPMRDGGMTR